MLELRGPFPSPSGPDPEPEYGCLAVLSFGLILFAVIVALVLRFVFHLDVMASLGL